MKYNYRFNNAALVTHSIWIDSSGIVNGDSTWFLNTIVSFCDTCPGSLSADPYDTSFVLTKQPQFLQRKITAKNTGIFQLTGNGNMALRVFESTGTPWLFDTLNNIHAFIAYKTVQPVFSIPDSVAGIVLSSSDTLLLSKSFGIVQFPGAYGVHQYYRLSGIEGLNSGEQTLKFPDFFDFNTGDIFQYRFSHYDFNSFPPLFNDGIKKVEVLGKTVIQDTIRYQVKITQLDSTRIGAGSAAYNYSTSVQYMDFIDSTDHFCNLFPEQEARLDLFFPNIPGRINQVKYDKDSAGLLVKRIGFNCYESYPDSLHIYSAALAQDTSCAELHLVQNTMLHFGIKAVQGLGITSEIKNEFDFVNINCMIGYFKGTDTIGTIYSDAEMTGIAALKKKTQPDFLLYPNPASTCFHLRFPDGFSGTLEVIAIDGKILLSQKTTGTFSERISTETWSDGIYTIRLVNGTETRSKRLVVSH